jgi:hypothetical protein
VVLRNFLQIQSINENKWSVSMSISYSNNILKKPNIGVKNQIPYDRISPQKTNGKGK